MALGMIGHMLGERCSIQNWSLASWHVMKDLKTQKIDVVTIQGGRFRKEIASQNQCFSSPFSEWLGICDHPKLSNGNRIWASSAVKIGMMLSFDCKTAWKPFWACQRLHPFQSFSKRHPQNSCTLNHIQPFFRIHLSRCYSVLTCMGCPENEWIWSAKAVCCLF